MKNPLIFLMALALVFSACTDYSDMFEEEYGHLIAEDDDANSSGSGKSSSSVKSSSSEDDVSSGKSSSSSKNYSSSSATGSVYDAETNTLTDLRDDKTYRTVTIGTQVWMAENLNYNYINGSVRSYCHNNDSKYCEKYGRLYEWKAAQDACPEGWRLPDDNEWNTLFFTVGAETPGRTLKSTEGWEEDGNGKDLYDFTVLPADYSFNGSQFDRIGYSAHFWSFSTAGGAEAHRWSFHYGNDGVTISYLNKSYALSVRCIKIGKATVSSSSEAIQSSSSEVAASSSSEPSLSSSSEVVLSSSQEQSSSSSVASSSSVKSSSSVASSSSVESSSSVVSSSSESLVGFVYDKRDGQSYKVVVIGTQTWMAENLNYKVNANVDSWCGGGTNSREGDCSLYGRVYLWDAALSACPEGFHLPDYDDFRTLIDFVGGTNSGGKKLKSVSASGTDDYGFNAILIGYGQDGYFLENGKLTYFWSSTLHSENYPYAFLLNTSSYIEFTNHRAGDYAFPIRCVKD